MWNLIKQTELISIIETNSYIDSRMTAGGWCQRVQAFSKNEKGFMNMDNSVVIPG